LSQSFRIFSIHRQGILSPFPVKTATNVPLPAQHQTISFPQFCIQSTASVFTHPFFLLFPGKGFISHPFFLKREHQTLIQQNIYVDS